MSESCLQLGERRYRMGDAPFIVGRDLRCDLCFAGDDQLSREHALFVPGAEAHCVVDLKSANGVLVNGARVPFKTLCDGDVLGLGAQSLVYRRSAPPPGEPSPAVTAALEEAGREFDRRQRDWWSALALAATMPELPGLLRGVAVLAREVTSAPFVALWRCGAAATDGLTLVCELPATGGVSRFVEEEVAEALRTGQPRHVVKDLPPPALDPDPTKMPCLLLHSHRAILVAPMVCRGVRFGALAAWTPAVAEPLNERAQGALEALAAVAALGVAAARGAT